MNQLFHFKVRYLTRALLKRSPDFEDSHPLCSLSSIYICQDDIEEEDCDAIEKVLWHQPKGMSGDAHTDKKLTVPVLLSQLFDSQPDWNEMEFLIKWKGQSHLHCQWKSLSDLQNVCPNDLLFEIFLFNVLYPRCFPPPLQLGVSAVQTGLKNCICEDVDFFSKSLFRCVCCVPAAQWLQEGT